MKIIITAALLLAVNLFAFSQASQHLKPGGELHAGYFRQTFKMRDLQVSPMMYVANLHGVSLSYARLTPRNQWMAETKVGMADLIAPKLGIRMFKFTEDQSQPLLLVPRLYRAELFLTYRRLLAKKAYRSSWAGISIQETFNYADGLAMTTWVMNTAALSLSYQTYFHLNSHHTIMGEAALPVLTLVSRLPYSNVISTPEQSNSAAFLNGSRLETLSRYLNPQISTSYRFTPSKRVAIQAQYRYNWLQYTEPRLIRSSSHTGILSFIYQF